MNAMAQPYPYTILEFSSPVQLSVFSPKWTKEVSTFGLSQWKIEAISQTLKLERLPTDWDSYGSPPPSNELADFCIDWLLKSIPFNDLPSPNVVPVSGGGIQFEWSLSDRELELEVLPNYTIEFLKTERGEPLDQGEVKNLQQIPALFGWLGAE